MLLIGGITYDPFFLKVEKERPILSEDYLLLDLIFRTRIGAYNKIEC